MTKQTKFLTFFLTFYLFLFFILFVAVKFMVSGLESDVLHTKEMIVAVEKKQKNLIAREQALASQNRITQIAFAELGMVPETGTHPVLVVPSSLIGQMRERMGNAQ